MKAKQLEMALDIDNDNMVYQGNSLALAHYDMTTLEQKLLLTMLSTIKKEDTKLKTTVFRVSDLAKIMGVPSDNLYRDLKKTCKSIMGKIIEIQKADGSWELFNIISHAEYKSQKGCIEITVNKQAEPYLLQLKELFTSFKLGNAMSMNSKYAIRIYQVCKANLFKKSYVLSLDELKLQLKLTQKSYQEYSCIRTKVLQPALKEINEKTDINITYEEIKVGRKVVSLKMFVSEKAKRVTTTKKTKTQNYNKFNKESSFNNFEPRQYDYDKLEKKLLGWE